MKKIIAVVSLLTILVMALTGCGSEAKKSSNSDKKVLKVITYAKWNPFEYIKNGQVVGFDIDLIKAVAKDAGYDVEIKDSGWEGVFQELKDGTADVAISGITITDERKQTYDFSLPYFVSRQGILVKENSTITGGKDLMDKMVAVQTGSTGEEAIEKLMGKNNSHIKKEKGEIVPQDIMHNSADAGIMDHTSIKTFFEENPKSGLKEVLDDASFEPENFGIMFSKNSGITEKLNTSLKHIIDNGEYSKIYKEWFHEDPKIDELKAK